MVDLSNRTLSFSDEFNRGDVLNTDATSPTWNTTFSGGLRNLPSFKEQQLYLDDNSTTLNTGATVSVDPFKIQDGALTISAAPTPAAYTDVLKTPYTSGLINTAGTFDFRYGYVEMRADMPYDAGVLPAFYMVRTDNVNLGEIDIVEYLADRPHYLHQTVWYSDDGVNRLINKTVRATVATDQSQGYHTYGVDWQPDYTIFYLDGQVTGRMVTPESLKAPMYILADMSVGSSFGSPVSASNTWPAEFKIDYIRVYQDASNFASVTKTGTSANDTLSGGDGADTLAGGDGNDTILGAGGHDSLSGGAGDDRLLGGQGNDTLDGGAGADKLEGGRGDDTYVINDTGNTIVEFANTGTDTVRTSLATYALGGNLETLVYTGTGAFAGTGNSFDNAITGGSGNDMLVGGAGNDTLSGGAGHDKLSGGLGNDVLWGGSGNDTLMGADGADTFLFKRGDSGTAFISDFQLGVDKLDLSGMGYTSLADVLTHASTSAQGHLVLSLGSEVLTLQNVKLAQLSDGDLLLGTGTTTPPTDTPPTPTPTTDPAKILTGTNGQDSLLGGSGHDQLTGLGGNDTLSGFDGNDTLDGGTGADVLVGGAGADQHVGGAGFDTASYANAGTGVALDMLDANWSGALGDAKGDSFASIEAVQGSAYDDVLLLTNGNDLASGGAGHDRIEGRDGADILKGMDGNDTLLGGTGYDTLDGGNGDDRLEGGTGNDSLIGGSGLDTAVFSGARANYTITDLGGGRFQVTDTLGTDGIDLLTGVEQASFAGQLSALSASSNRAPTDLLLSNNTVAENRAVGALVGTLSAVDPDTGDTASYVLLDDAGGQFSVVNGNQLVATGPLDHEALTVHLYTVQAQVTDSAGLSYVKALTIDVTDVNEAAIKIALSGSQASSTAVGTIVGTLTGTDPDVGDVPLLTLADDAGGHFRIDGGNLVVSSPLEAASYSVVVQATDPHDANLILQQAFTITPAGSTIIGTSGNNTLSGLGGNDTLDGGTGADVLVGGAGADQHVGGAGFDTASYANAGTGVALDMLDANWSGALGDAKGDSFASIEAVQGSVYDDVLLLTNGNDLASGGAGHDRIEGRDGSDILKGMDGNDTLLGGSGNDKLVGGAGADRLEGGSDQDILTGGSGNDTFVFAGPGTGKDLITDFAGGAGSGDVIEWHGQFTDFAAVQAHAQDVTGVASPFGGSFTGTVITTDGGDQVWLANVVKTNLYADDFAFL